MVGFTLEICDDKLISKQFSEMIYPTLLIGRFCNFTDAKAASQLFENFKSGDSFAIPVIFREKIYCSNRMYLDCLKSLPQFMALRNGHGGNVTASYSHRLPLRLRRPELDA